VCSPAGEDPPVAGDAGRLLGEHAAARRTDQQPRPRPREEILGALAHYEGAVVLVSHDEGAVQALNPERVLILPDGVEDIWGRDYVDLITLA
jgi:ABC-type sulfate/molybdate transport systems ATPase subunit